MTLITKDFSTGYQNNEIIKSINITLRNKEWLGIIGPNGSGKSTFLKGISRILKPTSGRAFINEYDIHLSSSNDIAKEISILPQLQTLDLQMSVYELVCLGRSPHKRWWETDLHEKDLLKVDQSLALTDMTNLKDKSVREFKIRLSIICCSSFKEIKLLEVVERFTSDKIFASTLILSSKILNSI